MASTEGATPEHSLTYSLADFRREADAIGFVLHAPNGSASQRESNSDRVTNSQEGA